LRRLGQAASEPHREFLLQVAARLHDRSHRSAAELLEDLHTLRDSLAAGGASRLAHGEVQGLIWQAETFGFHLAELEVRQHSKVIDGAPEETVQTLRVIADIQRRFGVDACRRFVVSFTRSARDVAAVYALARRLGKPPVLDVVPLFETLDDLGRATQVLDD